MNRQHIEVIGVDHGWSGMKTVSQVFTTGVKEITTEPAFFNNVVEFNGCYYMVGGKRLEVRDLKVENDNFYILTLAAVAKELNRRGMSHFYPCFRRWVMRLKMPTVVRENILPLSRWD